MPTYLSQRVLPPSRGRRNRKRRRSEKEKKRGRNNACIRETFSNCPQNETRRSLELHCSNSDSRVRVTRREGRRGSSSNFPWLNIESHATALTLQNSSKGKSWRSERLSFGEQSETRMEERRQRWGRGGKRRRRFKASTSFYLDRHLTFRPNFEN